LDRAGKLYPLGALLVDSQECVPGFKGDMLVEKQAGKKRRFAVQKALTVRK